MLQHSPSFPIVSPIERELGTNVIVVRRSGSVAKMRKCCLDCLTPSPLGHVQASMRVRDWGIPSRFVWERIASAQPVLGSPE